MYRKPPGLDVIRSWQMLISGMTRNPFHQDLACEGILGSTDTKLIWEYFQPQLSALAECNDCSFAKPWHWLPSERQISPDTNTTSSTFESLLHASSVNLNALSGSSSTGSTNSMGQMFSAQSSSICCKAPKKQSIPIHVAIGTGKLGESGDKDIVEIS